MPQPQKSKTTTRPHLPVVEGAASEVATEQALVPVPPPDNPSSVYVALDKADEELVAAEIGGDLIETWAYEFRVGSKDVRGLSFEGVNQGVRIMNARGIGRIKSATDPAPLFADTYDAEGNPIWECMAYAVDELVGGGSWGLAHAEKFPSKQGGGTYHDPMAKRKALSKAQRNAKAALIPGPIKLEILQGVTGLRLKRIQTDRQQAVEGAQARQIQRGNETTAAKPKREPTATQPQQRMLMGKFKEGGGPKVAKGLKVDEETVQKAVFGFFGGSLHVDRVLRDRVNVVRDALLDLEASLTALADNAREDNAPDHGTAVAVLQRLPELAKALGVDAGAPPPGEPGNGGEQGQLV